jgi:hypothetical protein
MSSPRKRNVLMEKVADLLSQQYQGDPVGYATHYLGVTLWAKQQECLEKLHQPPYRVLCRSANATGKTYLSACAASYWHDNYRPSIVLTTAPTQVQVRDLLFKELRNIRPLQRYFLPRATRIERNHAHFVHGFTAATPDAFQGRHADYMLLIFDEATGIRREFWERGETMIHSKPGHGWLAIYNPNDMSTPPYVMEQRDSWHHVAISALEHPNVIAGIAGLPPPYPAAVDYATVLNRIRAECDQVLDREPEPPIDFEFPLGSGKWYRPQTPDFDAQILGRWPAQPVAAVWSERMWAIVDDATRYPELLKGWKSQIGCDVARFGDDETTIHIRTGPCSVRHEAHKGWSTDRTAERLRELCHHHAHGVDPYDVPVCIDAGGVGGGVVDQSCGYRFIEVNGSTKPHQLSRYPNTRSELWFVTADLAKADMVDFSRLPAAVKHKIKMDLFAPSYSMDSLNRRVVEPKDRTKARLGRSPDHADAVNLAFYCW